MRRICAENSGSDHENEIGEQKKRMWFAKFRKEQNHTQPEKRARERRESRLRGYIVPRVHISPVSEDADCIAGGFQQQYRKRLFLVCPEGRSRHAITKAACIFEKIKAERGNNQETNQS